MDRPAVPGMARYSVAADATMSSMSAAARGAAPGMAPLATAESAHAASVILIVFTRVPLTAVANLPIGRFTGGERWNAIPSCAQPKVAWNCGGWRRFVACSYA